MAKDEEKRYAKGEHMEWRDYLAMAIAMLETTLLPIVIAAIVLVLFVFILRR
jgi:hypothetical protein